MSLYNDNKHLVLCASSLLLLNPIAFYVINSNRNLCETALACLLICVVVTSQIFWSNPVKYSKAHIVDGIIAKITGVAFITYIMICKNRTVSLYHIYSARLVVLCVCSTFYYSNKYSRKEWCCEKHIVSHAIFHFFCTIGCLLAYV